MPDPSLPPERRAELVERVRKHWSPRPIFLLSPDELAVWAVDILAPELAERDQARALAVKRGDELVELTEAHTKLLQERNGLAAALRRYGSHEWRCDASAYPVESFPCTCGLQAVLDAIDGKDTDGR